jgi:hypothetical protein
MQRLAIEVTTDYLFLICSGSLSKFARVRSVSQNVPWTGHAENAHENP